ncbi:unnamed protein product [Lepeophtheirus salmonis]|uniref:(salmon louse) hypothetical protein n=1 Tax=Lepeophtheirus salmonis TaxID=72036 RepID=A0A7R8CER8_LEPSM|nr:unnamed protein product [Lepeophtheirus salmonis]CAF2798503.1 unnamed protein product [Lepeophtheirus salmonis]
MFRVIWGRPGDQPRLMRFEVVVFCLVSAPYLSMWCLKETAKKVSNNYPIASEVIDKMIYIEDNHIAQDTPEETIQTTLEILKILKSGGFYGHKIASSHPEILSEIEPERIAQPRGEISVLGLKFLLECHDKWPKQPRPTEVSGNKSKTNGSYLAIYLNQIRAMASESHKAIVYKAQNLSAYPNKDKEPIQSLNVSREESEWAEVLLIKFEQETRLVNEIKILRDNCSESAKLKLVPGSPLMSLPVFLRQRIISH